MGHGHGGTGCRDPCNDAREQCGVHRPGVGIGLRANPIAKACAGRATANRNTTTSSMLPDQSEPPNRYQTHGNARAETDPARAAVTGVSVIFTLRDRVGLDGRKSSGYAMEVIGRHGVCQGSEKAVREALTNSACGLEQSRLRGLKSGSGRTISNHGRVRRRPAGPLRQP